MTPFLRRTALTLVFIGLPSLGWADTRRFALIAGANDGGDARTTLRYAVTDATAFGAVLESIGGVPPSNQTLLIEPNTEVLAEAIHNLAQTVAVAEERGMRTEVVFYYSGHSDEEGLLLGETRYDYPRLRADLEAIGADVRIAVLDSCASGALVRTKGGVQRPAFLEDRSNDVEGTAYLMSSSADEASQESDAIGASFFTHYLVSGMRGGADQSQDGRVTLDEAYRYATEQTLKRTERSSLGAQHATYSYKLGGHGDFVFTDLSATSSSLILDGSLEGQFFVRTDAGDLVAEVDTTEPRAVELALSPGLYTVVLQAKDKQYDAVFEIGEAEHLMASDLDYLEFQGELVSARGGPSMVAELPKRDTRLQASLFIARAGDARVQMGMVGVSSESHIGGQFALGYTEAQQLDGLQASVVFNQADELRGAQAALVNIGGQVDGVQLGAVNHAESARGLQLGLVNSGGDGGGLQVGLVNIARDYKGAAVGLITVHKKGYNHLFLNTGTMDPYMVSASWGSRYVYTSLQLGGKFKPGGVPSLALGAGAHLPIQKFYIDGDLAGGYRFGGDFEGPVARLRVQPGLPLGDHLAIQTGVVFEAQAYLQASTRPGVDGDLSLAQLGRTVGWTVGLRF